VTRSPAPASGLFDEDEDVAAQVGERLRRIALGITAALIVVRAYFPGEDADTGSGLGWVLAILTAAGVAILGLWASGKTRLRLSWVDACVLALVMLVGLSTSMAADRRPAISLAWEWVGWVGVYFLVRNLPRAREESSALAGIFVATAVAVAAYGLYQVGFELPQLKAQYLSDPNPVLAKLHIDPLSSSRRAFEQRLLASLEPFSTFALANSLAGFLVGAAVVALGVALDNALRRETQGSAVVPLVLATPPIVVILACLLLTKSRSAYIGMLIGVVPLAWLMRGQVQRRTLVLAGATLGGLLVALVAAAAAARQLDWMVLTESAKSLRYRSEYWVATWRMLTSSGRIFAGGVGPGNFAGPYLRFKLPQSSEEIIDPHNMVLDVWAAAGVIAALVLVASLGLALREVFAKARAADDSIDGKDSSMRRSCAESMPPRGTTWLWICGGCGGWLAIVGMGKLNPFEGDGLGRWLVLGVAWGWAALMLWLLWRRRPTPVAVLGAGALAIMVNLLAAGGIGIPPVAIALWTLIALAQNLREDRPSGRRRIIGGRWLAFGLAACLAALIGSFVGVNVPLWQSEAAMADAQEALQARRPDFDRAMDAYIRAAQFDHYSVQPWLGLADLRFQRWEFEGSPPGERVWIQIAEALDRAAAPPRNPNALIVQRRRMAILHELIARQSPANKDMERMRADLLNAAAKAVKLYPNNAPLHAELAEASAATGRFAEAAREARSALQLDDAIARHPDKRLPKRLRKRLEEEEARWRERAQSVRSVAK
jgi:hypothetical protein